MDNSKLEDFDNISKETLFDLLQKKSKEMKMLQTKLQKIEEKYVKIFKENKLISKDREALVQFLQHLSQKIEIKPIGEFDLQLIQKTWDNVYIQDIKEYQSTINIVKNENQQLNQIIKEMEQGVNLKYQEQNQKQQESLLQKDNQIQNSEDLIQELNQEIKKKDEIIKQLKEIEYEYSQQKSQLLLEELQQNYEKMNTQADIKQNEINNKLLLTKGLLEDANMKVCELQNQIDPQNHNYPQFSKEGKQMDFQSQTINFECQQCKEYESKQLKQINQNPQDKLNVEYLKQVVLRFICFTESKNHSQAKVLLNVIMTILQFDQKHINLIDQAKQQGTIWNNARSFFNDSFGQINEFSNKNSQDKPTN